MIGVHMWVVSCFEQPSEIYATPIMATSVMHYENQTSISQFTPIETLFDSLLVR